MTTSKRADPDQRPRARAARSRRRAPRRPAEAAEAAAAPIWSNGSTNARPCAAERDTLADALLRLRAEFDNYRRRASRELVEARERAQGDLLSDLLPVLDNLERALDAAEHHEEGKVLGGVRMTRDLFVDLLAPRRRGRDRGRGRRVRSRTCTRP